jgi:hypothetical protein
MSHIQNLAAAWLSEATAHFRKAKELVANPATAGEAQQHIALGEECFLHADELRLCTQQTAAV